MPSHPPCELTAGDSASWSVTLPDHPAPEWAVTFTFIGSEAVHSVAATPDGEAHQVVIAAGDTAAWAPGRYRLVGFASKGDQRRTFHSSHLQLQPDPAQAGAGDTRTHARRVLDAIEKYLETGDMVAGQVQIADRRIAMIAVADLLALRDRYRAEVKRECGGSVGGRVYTRLG